MRGDVLNKCHQWRSAQGQAQRFLPRRGHSRCAVTARMASFPSPACGGRCRRRMRGAAALPAAADRGRRVWVYLSALTLNLHELAQLKTPCELHWDLNHFVVLKSVGNRSVVIHDPSRGVRKVSLRAVSGQPKRGQVHLQICRTKLKVNLITLPKPHPVTVKEVADTMVTQHA